MTKLSCNVNDCASNCNNMCCRSNIEINGKYACSCGETCCKSYMPKSSAAVNGIVFRNSNPALEISCKAENCIHNRHGRCHAENVNITNGTTGTECESFRQA